VELTPDDNGTFLVTCPALPEVTTFGSTEEEIQRSALGAIEEAIAARIAHGEADITFGTDDTEHLLHSPANAAALGDAIKELEGKQKRPSKHQNMIRHCDCTWQS
jgi:predicted RNase H-like HicB family nuclease